MFGGNIQIRRGVNDEYRSSKNGFMVTNSLVIFAWQTMGACMLRIGCMLSSTSTNPLPRTSVNLYTCIYNSWLSEGNAIILTLHSE